MDKQSPANNIIGFQNFFGLFNHCVLIDKERIVRNCKVVIAPKQTYTYANIYKKEVLLFVILVLNY